MKKKIMIISVVILVMVVSIVTITKLNKKDEIQEEGYEVSTEIDIVMSLEDKIGENTAWCGTFNLIWNDLKQNLAKQDIIFSKQTEKIDNLNKGTFTTNQLSEDSYYKVYGVPSLQLKSEIEKAIQEKFNETSSILDSFDWKKASPEDYFLYAMLKKEFKFPNVFTELENGKFGKYENVQYFGINESTESDVRDQVEVLYYESKENFAVRLLTKENDEVIMTRGNKEETFGQIYESIQEKERNYEGSHHFEKGDTLKIPNINFNVKKEFQELENQPFFFSNGEEYEIQKALQTIEFELDKTGGKVKSEAGMMITKSAAMLPAEPREFMVDDTFSILLIERGKDLPYFAAQISDISKVQNGAK